MCKSRELSYFYLRAVIFSAITIINHQQFHSILSHFKTTWQNFKWPKKFTGKQVLVHNRYFKAKNINKLTRKL